MPSFSNIRRVPFTAQQMFDLVADVEKYPEFLPLCESLSVLTRRDAGPQTVLDARMGVGYKAIHEVFTSRVTLNPAGPAILVEYLDGPFKRLENRWRFLAAPGGSDIDFYVDYEFRSPILAVLMGVMFDKAFRQFAAAFEERARKVYGVAAVASGPAGPGGT
jgi:coenzyme Q-binding protein COQ10